MQMVMKTCSPFELGAKLAQRVLGTMILDIRLETISALGKSCCRFTIKRICRIGILQQIRKLSLYDIQDRKGRRPRLVQRVQTDGSAHFVDVRMVDSLYKANRRALEGKFVRNGKAYSILVSLVRRVFWGLHLNNKGLHIVKLFISSLICNLESSLTKLLNITCCSLGPHFVFALEQQRCNFDACFAH